MDQGKLATYYDNVMEGYINPTKNSNSELRDYLSPIWENGQELISNINTSNQYLSEMNNVDAIEIDVINFLKGSLAKV